MKKFFVAIIAIVVAAVLVWCVMTPEDPYSIDKYGSIWYATSNAAVTVRRMDCDTELYQVYLCYVDNGVVNNYQKMGIYEKDNVARGVDQAVEFYWANESLIEM